MRERGRANRAAGQRRNAEFQLATTSDVAFLLLIFFLSTAIFLSPYGLPMVLPPSGAEPLAVPAEDLARIALDARGAVLAEGVSRTREALVAWARSKKESRGGIVFQIDVHPLCSYEKVVAVVDVLREAGADRVHFDLQGSS